MEDEYATKFKNPYDIVISAKKIENYYQARSPFKTFVSGKFI